MAVDVRALVGQAALFPARPLMTAFVALQYLNFHEIYSTIHTVGGQDKKMTECSGYVGVFMNPCPKPAKWINRETGNAFCDAHKEAIESVTKRVYHRGFEPILPIGTLLVPDIPISSAVGQAADAIQRAVMAERERCARAIEGFVVMQQTRGVFESMKAQEVIERLARLIRSSGANDFMEPQPQPQSDDFRRGDPGHPDNEMGM